ncbi:hypothetical protein QTP88_023388 [Uroleucon formosanum]
MSSVTDDHSCLSRNMDTLLKSIDDITAELYRQLDEDDMSYADDSSSETEDHVLENDNVVADDFQLSSDEEYDEEIEADREFFLGKDQETIWSSQPLNSKYSRTPVCKNNYTPSEYVTVDETLLSFPGRCPFKMYLPAKPDKYGLKIISICDAKTFYFYGGIPYIGKETRNPNDLLIPTQYVLNLMEPIMGTNRNVTTDNWFTSIELAEQLRVKKLTLVAGPYLRFWRPWATKF